MPSASLGSFAGQERFSATPFKFECDTLGVVAVVAVEIVPALDGCCAGVDVGVDAGLEIDGTEVVLLYCKVVCADTKETVFGLHAVAFPRNRRKLAASWAGSVFS